MRARPSWWLVAILLVVTAFLTAGGVLLAVWVRANDPDLPPLLTNLGGTWDEASATFTTRLRHRYPPGTPETRLRTDLAVDGFRLTWRQPYNGYEADLQWTQFPCGMRASVTWRTDMHRRITDVRSRYQETGCL
jgi:hypothetical protein